MEKNGFTLPEVLIAMLILIVIFGIFGISMIASFRVAKINWDMDGVVKEVSYLDFLLSELMGKAGCDMKDNIKDIDNEATQIKIMTYDGQEIKIMVNFNTLKIKTATLVSEGNLDYLKIEATYTIHNSTPSEIELKFPIPDYCD